MHRVHKLARLRGKSETEADEPAALLLTPIVRQAVHEAAIQWITEKKSSNGGDPPQRQHGDR